MITDADWRVDFTLQQERVADCPPEARGLRRDEVRLLVSRDGVITHTRFSALWSALDPGDLLVVNDSRTLPSAVSGVTGDGQPVLVHFSTPLDDGTWTLELRADRAAQGPLWDLQPETRVHLPADVIVSLLGPYPDPDAQRTRLWRAEVSAVDVVLYLKRVGRPISYAHVTGDWSLQSFQTMFAAHDGSAEMPSAGRPFTRSVTIDLARAGIAIAPITLHTVVSSSEAGEPPLAERFSVSPQTAEQVNRTRTAGSRVIAVGTTVTRALESVAEPDGTVGPGRGWTSVVLGPDRHARAVEGIITGWHSPGSTHLDLVGAVVGIDPLKEAYEQARAHSYLWHEFGDSSLLLRHDPA